MDGGFLLVYVVFPDIYPDIYPLDSTLFIVFIDLVFYFSLGVAPSLDLESSNTFEPRLEFKFLYSILRSET